MKKFITNKYFILAARIILSLVFIFAAAEKISDPQAFAKVIYNYKLFPEFVINISALIIPWIELVAALLLIFGIAVKENAAILNSLLIIFILLIGVSMIRDLNIECGCFGTASGSKVGWQKIVENIGLLVLGFLIFYFDKEDISLFGKSRIKDKAGD